MTLGQLAQMTSGYADYVENPDLIAKHFAEPFRHWTPEELVSLANPANLLYEPGTDWDYAHTNYVILGFVLEKVTGEPMSTLMRDKVLGPLGLDNTTDPGSAAITQPALHSFTSERRDALAIPATTPFYEESTY